ncbi:MAG: hypothetical protein ACLFV3_10395 [Phycisphaeraceae bacterium]
MNRFLFHLEELLAVFTCPLRAPAWTWWVVGVYLVGGMWLLGWLFGMWGSFGWLLGFLVLFFILAGLEDR